MAEKLIIVMANTDPRNGEELGAPIFQATVAAAMDYEVDVICTATSGRLMKKGVAEKLFVKEGSPKSVYSFIQDAHEAGAKFYCCSPNLDLFDMTEDDLNLAQVDPLLQQVGDHVNVPRAGGHEQRGGAVAVHRVHRDPGLQQATDLLEITGPAGCCAHTTVPVSAL